MKLQVRASNNDRTMVYYSRECSCGHIICNYGFELKGWSKNGVYTEKCTKCKRLNKINTKDLIG